MAKITDFFKNSHENAFEHYYDLYDIVSVHNENRINPLAISNIITFMTDKFSFVNQEDKRSLTARTIFAPHHVYGCVKDTFSKQILSAERKDAIKTALKYLEEEGLVDKVVYPNCSTRHYAVTGEQYLSIVEKYNDIDTQDEQNIKISKEELHDKLLPFFDNALCQNETNKLWKSKNSVKILDKHE